ncbi:Helicase, C-terminal domain and Helicase-associated domain and DNA/RNA helicase, DEAD/DEAH box type, N-terminal domain and Domain of unknown function DUF1605 domain and Helicase, superfamily 1/2, ATP-binding domain and P-loop containing nucleoside triphosphate hydrolase domain-containing protein [Strongyloides ratti]|uniref:Uncharacterized protein n=1 Tax=Strongyloides ratti TaxID=34506 RepID=A0A090L4Z4_STRRB|nr:Helicase, C-terminal domain and Helicase-associated domain and DNA/RNA helicase, DEAD/DEAH box type, N-terminal domain and Domain of unknown function DUF1605 domain and Helicase, superfamily 1/2, ATP-binding domain and P-loop containing nucleoside triphosphate hydrolase domain-containing protein [Strongyloides ratti]CEF63172.1 Helicase, C-terminal domain and Helicase-associated domain and DNA/RNA helicase, DEAD/DEAH box type, N-terminal domain and Domain of unknown function DUF1605 domain and H
MNVNISNIQSNNTNTVPKKLDEDQILIPSDWVIQLCDVWIFKERSYYMISQLVSLIEKIEIKFSIKDKKMNDVGVYIYDSVANIILSKLNYSFFSQGKGISTIESINDCAWNIIHNLKDYCQSNSSFLSRLSDYVKQLPIQYFENEKDFYKLYQPSRKLLNIGGNLISYQNSKFELERIVKNKYSSIDILINRIIYINNSCFYFIKKSTKLNKQQIHGYGFGKNLLDAENEACYNIFYLFLQKSHLRGSCEDMGRKYLLKENIFNVEINSDLEKEIEKFITTYKIKTTFVPKTVLSRMNLIPKIQPKVCNGFRKEVHCILKPWNGPKMNYNCWSDSMLTNDNLYYNMELDKISEYIRKKENEKCYFDFIENKRKRLPIYMEREKILKIIKDNQLILIRASTGSGKSTQIPQILLKDFINQGKGAEFNCIVTQPRRLCATSLANEVAYERYEFIGESVGYSVRFDRVDPRPFGSIVYTTTGTLLQSIYSGLKGITHIIIDEIHERTLSLDFLLIILKKIIKNNSSIKIILMSATVDVEMFKNYFENIYVYQLTIPLYDVKLFYLEEIIQEFKFIPYGYNQVFDNNNNSLSFEKLNDNDNISKKAKTIATEIEINESIPYNLIIEIIKKMITIDDNDSGSILVFLPGLNEIFVLKKLIEEYLEIFSMEIITLHSSLSLDFQNLEPSKSDKKVTRIFLSTNIAESSITVPDISCVIDTGKVRSKCSSSTSTSSILHTIWTSQYSMEQRTGRGGRTRNGYCYRLCTRSLFNKLPKKQKAEMHSEPLSYILLMIKSLGLGDPYKFLNSAIEPPPIESIKNAEGFLQSISALDKDKNLTAIGYQMVNFSLDPLQTKSLLISILFNVTEEMTFFLGYDNLSIPFFSKKVPQLKVSETIKNFLFKDHSTISDHFLALSFHKNVYNNTITVGEYENNCTEFCINKDASSVLFKTYKQIERKLKNNFLLDKTINKSNEKLSKEYKEFILCSLLLNAYYPNIGYVVQSKSTSKPSLITLNDFEGNLMKIRKDSSTHFAYTNGSMNFLKKSSPFFLYSKKIKTEVDRVAINLTNITPIQLLLFGCSNIYIDENIGVELDQKIRINMNKKVASHILGIRGAIDNLLESLCCNGKLTQEEEEIRNEIVKLIVKLSTI